MEILTAIKRVLLPLGVLAAAYGQPAFEVASIRPSNAAPGSSSGIGTRKGRVNAENVTLKRCMRGAYGIPESQIFGGPKWVDEDRYDIIAKADRPVGDRALNIMLQSLLAERFKLVFHRETRPLRGYALLVGKGGLKAKPSDPDAESVTNGRRGGLDAKSCTMAQLAMKLSEAVHLPVANLTAIEGKFDLKLEWTPDDMQAKPPSGGDSAQGPSLFAALQEQLGLKLESRKVPTEVLVIDSADKPSEN